MCSLSYLLECRVGCGDQLQQLGMPAKSSFIVREGLYLLFDVLLSTPLTAKKLFRTHEPVDQQVCDHSA